MASDTDAEWERYIMWSARRHLDNLRNNPDDNEYNNWCDKWYDIYFRIRRQFESYVALMIEKLPLSKVGDYTDWKAVTPI